MGRTNLWVAENVMDSNSSKVVGLEVPADVGKIVGVRVEGLVSPKISIETSFMGKLKNLSSSLYNSLNYYGKEAMKNWDLNTLGTLSSSHVDNRVNFDSMLVPENIRSESSSDNSPSLG